MNTSDSTPHAPPGLIDLAAERVGGIALIANDEFFAEKEHLLTPGRGIFIQDRFTDRGKWMDGWETRRRRKPGNDWCVIQLGLRGVIRTIDIDTNHFLGNHPPFASVDAISKTGNFPKAEAAVGKLSWKSVLKKSPLNPGSQNLFEIRNDKIWTHLRLNIFPDGGIARLRVYGIVVPDWTKIKPGNIVDLAAVENGGVPLACSDMFFSSMNNLIMPGRAKNMGDGWETKRRRGPGHDWIILKLGAPGSIRRIEVDTNHFKGNFPDTCSIEGCNAPGATVKQLIDNSVRWRRILSKTKLRADERRLFERELARIDNCTHVRLNIYPDGGVSRLRVWGTVA